MIRIDKRGVWVPFARIAAVLCVVAMVSGLAVASSTTFKVMTYNIHHGERLDGVLDLAGQAQYLLSTGADIIGLQEVDVGTARTSRVDQAEFLGMATGFNTVFTSHFDYQGGQYGLALLTRFPIVVHESFALPTAQGAEEKSLLKATVDARGTLVDVYVLHLEVRNLSVRNAQAAKVAEILSQGTNPAIVMGDFNAISSSQVTEPIRYQFLDSYVAGRFLSPSAEWDSDTSTKPSYTAGGATWPVVDPQNRGDYIWHSHQLAPVGLVESPGVEWADHRPVIATFQLLPEADQAMPVPEIWSPTRQVSVLIPNAAREWLLRNEITAEALVDTLTDWFADASIEAYHVTSMDQALPGSLVLVPGGRFLTADDMQALQSHVMAGGGLLAWGDVAVESPEGAEVRSVFERLVGIEYLGWSYGYPTRNAIHVDLGAAGWPDEMIEQAGFWQFEGPTVRVLPGARQLGSWLNSKGAPSFLPDLNAAIVQNGRAVYIGATPFHPIDRDNPEMRALVTGIVRYLSEARG